MCVLALAAARRCPTTAGMPQSSLEHRKERTKGDGQRQIDDRGPLNRRNNHKAETVLRTNYQDIERACSLADEFLPAPTRLNCSLSMRCCGRLLAPEFPVATFAPGHSLRHEQPASLTPILPTLRGQ